MLPSQLQSLIEEYCMGMQPTDAQIDEIIDLAISLSADSSEVAQYIEKMQQGPTKEERDAIAKAEAERKAKEEAKRKAKEEAERKAKAEAERKADAERKAKEEAKRKAEAERKAKEEAERKAKEEAKRKAEAERKAKEAAEKAERERLAAIERAKREKEEAERKAKEAAERAQREKEEAERTNGHEYVDFGLPTGTLWATCNIGASSPEQYGDLFAWGETQTKKEFKLSNHKHSKRFLGIFSDATKYKVDEECTQLELEDDAARAQWGGAWEMPTDLDFYMLFLCGNVEAATINGIAGLRVSRNGKSIFFPKAGAEGFGSFAKKGEAGRYWTSSTKTEKKGDTYVITDDSAAESMHLYGNKAEAEDCIMRYCGLSIRPVIHNYKSRNI